MHLTVPPGPALARALGGAWAVVLALSLGGCASGPAAPSAPAAPGASAPLPRGDARGVSGGPLRAERLWLQAWFRDTPVRVAERDGGAAVLVEVPREFCFEAGRSELKPALTAVLDKVAESLRRVPSARLPLIAAPDDGGRPTAALAEARAARVQRHLRSRGVAAHRLGRPGVSTAAAVQLRLEAAPPAP